MKALKTLSLFVFSLIVTSCFESPEFDNVPHIVYRKIYFGISKDPAQMDSLVVEIDFEDGDGDLGLDNRFRNYPYHEFDYYLTDGSVLTTPLQEFYVDNTSSLSVMDVPSGATGLLVRQGDIAGLPDGCEYYKTGTVNVLPENANIFNETYTYEEHLDPRYFEVSGTFYVNPNPDNKNITVRFFYLDPLPDDPNRMTEYKWECQTFDGRFEVLSEKETALSGKLRYTMSSFGFSNVMAAKSKWQLRFTIKDRSRNTSNEVVTQLFTLGEITQ